MFRRRSPPPAPSGLPQHDADRNDLPADLDRRTPPASVRATSPAAGGLQVASSPATSPEGLQSAALVSPARTEGDQVAGRSRASDQSAASVSVETSLQDGFGRVTSGAYGSQRGWMDPATLMRIKQLQLRAKVIVEGFFSGLHRSPYHGFSVEFTEYRQYTPGDDLRYLDWRLYARTDRYYIKRFEDETNLRCTLLLDLSRSMGFGSLSYTKADYARTLAATLAYFLISQRDAVGLLTFADQLTEYMPARYRPGQLHRLMLGLEHSLIGQETRLGPPLEQVGKSVSKRGLLVLISDLLAPLDELERELGYLRSRGHEIVIFRVLDPVEVHFRWEESALFEDLETGRELYVDPTAVRDEYLRRFEAHATDLRTICSSLGVDLISMSTDEPLERTLFDFLQARLRRGRQVMRRASGESRAARGRPAPGGPSG